MEWKWTKGEAYERSRRPVKNAEEEHMQTENKQFSKDQEQFAYTSSLHHDENTWEILNQTNATNGFKISNKREDIGNKLADRQMVQQRGFNPFMSDNNYLDDIAMRDEFLKPVNTSQDKINVKE